MKRSLGLLLIFIFFINCLPSIAQKPVSQEQLDKLSNVLQIINYAYVDSVKSDKLVENAITGMLQQLDPHSVYISKEELKEMNEPLEGNFEGIGIQFNILRDTLTVVSTIEGGPSQKLGILAGDKIVRIEGQSIAGIKLKNNDLMKKLRGSSGSMVTVSVMRKGKNKLIDYTITRDKIPIYSVDASYMATPQVGYIKVNRFSMTTLNEFRKALTKLKSKGAQDLILDLTDNGGGYLNTAIDLADEFLDDKKLIVYTEGTTSPKTLSYATQKGNFEKGKLIILINENSASASEIVSGAVQDWDRGLIVGRRSYGKGLVQKPFPLSDGSLIRLTTARYYTPVGRCIQKPYENGLESYYKDLDTRYSHGELTSRDSIHFPDSLKFFTPNHRTVYGGGGIMPDIFVPLDTSKNSEYNSELIRKSVLNNFSFELVDKYRDILTSAYPNMEDFKKRFKVDKKMLDDLITYGEREGVKKNEKEFETSREIIALQLKALIARDLWGNDEFYEIINELNPAYTKAIEVFKSDGFKKLKINSFSMK